MDKIEGKTLKVNISQIQKILMWLYLREIHCGGRMCDKCQRFLFVCDLTWLDAHARISSLSTKTDCCKDLWLRKSLKS